MLIRDLQFKPSNSAYWKAIDLGSVRIATPADRNTYVEQGRFWVSKGRSPDEWHENLDEFEAQAVLDHYLNPTE